MYHLPTLRERVHVNSLSCSRQSNTKTSLDDRPVWADMLLWLRARVSYIERIIPMTNELINLMPCRDYMRLDDLQYRFEETAKKQKNTNISSSFFAVAILNYSLGIFNVGLSVPILHSRQLLFNELKLTSIS